MILSDLLCISCFYYNKRETSYYVASLAEVPSGVEPLYLVLQTSA